MSRDHSGDHHSTPAIEVRGLRKAFETTTVLDGIDLTVDSGSVFALLGPNGAGKTTMVHILCTLLPSDAGSARVGGYDTVSRPDDVRSLIGVTGQFAAVDGLLTGRENVQLMADLHHLERDEGRRRIAALLEQFDLEDAASKQASTYSGGMQRRLDLAMTLVGDPRIIFLDEPTTGLDPRSRRTMWEIIRRLADDGVTIFLTTQYLDEADRLADHIAVLDGGRLVAEGSAEELKRLVPGGHIRLTFGEERHLDDATAAFPDSVVDTERLAVQVPSRGGVDSIRDVLDRIDRAQLEVEELSVHTPDLDDVFLALTSERALTGTREGASR
jgi:ABC-2 type transport system ATP-binding protein